MNYIVIHCILANIQRTLLCLVRNNVTSCAPYFTLKDVYLRSEKAYVTLIRLLGLEILVPMSK